MSKLTLWSWGGIAALAAILAVVAWIAWDPPAEDVPRAREYRDYDMCLLTDSKGITDGPAKASWAGLQEVSKRTNVRVSYLTVSGEQTEARAQQFVATQVQQRCGIIVAVGQTQVAAAKAVEASYPSVKFVPVLTEADAAAVAAKVEPMVPKP